MKNAALMIFVLVLSCMISAKASTFTVNSRALDGSNTPHFVTYTASCLGMYEFDVSGTYQYTLSTSTYWADAGWATLDSWATITPKVDGTPRQDTPIDPALPTPAGILMLWFSDGSENFHEWGEYSSSHTYSTHRTLTAGQQLTFWISDWYPYSATDYQRSYGPQCYADNSGFLTVSVAVEAVPEPSSFVALGALVVPLLARSRCRKH